LDAAVSAFASRGFYASTTREIAAAAGFSPAAVYMHFPSKEDLLSGLITDTYREIHDILAAAKSQAVTPSGALSALVHAQVLWHFTFTTRARVAIDESRALPPGPRAEVARLREDIRRMYERVIEEGVAAGRFSVADVPVATSMVASLASGVGRWFPPDAAFEPEALAKEYATLALNSLGYRDSAVRHQGSRAPGSRTRRAK
jgi:AcrR family transcriptional regulator